jgi:cholesterol oxidase
VATDFDVIIIGSGFGATVLAIDQSAKGKSVLILERGVWWSTPELTGENPLNNYLKSNPNTQPVQYWPRPDHRRGLIDFLSVVKANGPLGDLQDFANGISDFFSNRKRPQPLYRYNTFADADIVTASGVGGGSLIYSNVTLEPFFDTASNSYPVMDSWPASARLSQAHYADGLNWMTNKRGTPNQVVTKYPQPVPVVTGSDPRLLGRPRFLRDASVSPNLRADLKAQIAEPWAPLKLQVNEADPAIEGTNKNFCERQGRCFLGCLPGARHTLNKALLKNIPDLVAEKRVFLRPLAQVDFIEPIAEGYTVHYKGLEEDGGNFHPTAKTVILAAGCLGSTELLLRSQHKTNGQLTLSGKLGESFSTNGDFSGFIVVDRDKLKYPIYATRGPINTSHVTFRDGKLLVNVEDAGIPSMFAALTEKTLDMLSKNTKADLIGLLGLLWDNAQLPDYSNPNDMQTEAEMLMNVCWFNCMGVDDASGKFTLENGRLNLTFKQKISDHPTFQKAEAILREMATAMNGTYRAFPTWAGLEPFISRKLTVTHPLGGCPIGGSSTDGVVNAKGQVFNTQSGAQTVHAGLYVADGSIIPGPLAVNPTLTIVSAALRIAAGIP